MFSVLLVAIIIFSDRHYRIIQYPRHMWNKDIAGDPIKAFNIFIVEYTRISRQLSKTDNQVHKLMRESTLYNRTTSSDY